MTRDRETPDGRWFQYRLATLCWLTVVVASFMIGSRWGVILPPQSHQRSTSTVKINDGLDVVFEGGTANPPAAAREDQVMPNRNTQRRFTVAIVGIQPDGSLRLRGEGTTRRDSGDAHYEFSGEIQPEHIRPDNTVFSKHVADLDLRVESVERK